MTWLTRITQWLRPQPRPPMKAPHVAVLRYALSSPGDRSVLPSPFSAVPTENRFIHFYQPPPVEWENVACRMRLEDDVVTCEMKEHFPTMEDARARLQPLLRVWEVQAVLELNVQNFRFVFERCEIVDQASPKPSRDIYVAEHLQGVILLRAPLSLWPAYPDPPRRLAVSPDVETMCGRYEGYLAGQEKLTSMAYMCLTVFQASAGGERRKRRRQAAERYGLSVDVLKKLGELTTRRGDERTARKAAEGGAYRSLTAEETVWIEAVVKALVRRAGEWAYDPNAALPELSMADFPPLPPE